MENPNQPSEVKPAAATEVAPAASSTKKEEPATQAPADPKKVEHVVEFKNVTKKFGDKVVLDNISFHVEDAHQTGELVTIVGQSGCGKSTLCKLIAGLEPQHPPTSGEVLCFGKPVTGPAPDRGVVDQKYSLLPHLTTLENIAFGLKLKGMPKKEREEIAHSWVKKIELTNSEKKYPHELSGGMQQRVAIAASLVLKPRIILMDEPFGALDPKIRSQMQTLLVELWKEQDSTIFLITHSAEEACYLGDRVIVMNANPGTIAEIIPAPRPDRPLKEMRKEAAFRELCDHIREKLENQKG